MQEILVAPLSYAEMIAGTLSVVVLRASVTGIGILLMGVCFGAAHVVSWPLFLFWIVSVSAVFGLLGIIVGLWSKSFEQLNMPVVFFLTPLSMVGGIFNTVGMLPDRLRWLPVRPRLPARPPPGPNACHASTIRRPGSHNPIHRGSRRK